MDTTAAGPTIRPHPTRDGVQVVDPIQETQFALLTPDSVTPTPCDTDRFCFPADTGATIRTDTVETAYTSGVWVREPDGSLVAEVTDKETKSVPAGSYSLGLTATQINVQLAVDGALTVDLDDDRTRITSPGAEALHVGARSVHDQPAGTVTTTDDPGDVMAALSTLGSALKTTSCERSFPTLRGHPPLIERGSELSVPDGIEAPDTGVTIQVPRSFEYIYPVAPLAYYLGATVESDAAPALVTDGWEYPLNAAGDFETTVARVLQQVFLLDCVTRTEGYYQNPLAERRTVEDAVDLDFAALYDRSLAEQVEAYLDVPFEAVADAVPKWKLTADVRPQAEYVSALPFLADELAVVRCPSRRLRAGEGSGETSELVDSFFRDQYPRAPSASRGLLRGEAGGRASRSTASQTGENTVVRPDEADSIEQAYVGEGIPVNASKMTVDAYYRRLEFTPSTEPRIRVVVVCNDEEMTDENVVSDIYGTREWFQFDIAVEEQLTTDELRETLTRDADLLHYIGHVDDEGIRCPDGYLDATELETVNVSAFLLNACDSYDQGRALIEAGAMGGIATMADIINEAATSVGRTIAKLLNQGFPLAAAVEMIKEYEQIGHHYLAIGDGSTSIVENQAGTPHKSTIDSIDDDQFALSLFGYPTLNAPMGTIFKPKIDSVSEFYLNSGEMEVDSVTRAELLNFVHQQDMPLDLGGSLQWSGDVTDF
jgi:hypothetical protein